jgi:hypothetical protein
MAPQKVSDNVAHFRYIDCRDGCVFGIPAAANIPARMPGENANCISQLRPGLYVLVALPLLFMQRCRLCGWKLCWLLLVLRPRPQLHPYTKASRPGTDINSNARRANCLKLAVLQPGRQ